MSGYFGLNQTQFLKYAQDLTRTQFYYGTLILVPLCVIFNTLQAVVFTKSKSFSKSTTGFLLSVLGLLDTISLVWCIIIYKYLPLAGFNLGLVNDFTCFTFQWFSRVIQQVPLYFQVLITIHNYLKVKHPSPSNFLSKKSTILLILVAISITDGLLNISNMFRYLKVKQTVSNSTNLTVITKSCSASHTMAIVANFSTSLFRSYIPGISMFILDILMVKMLVNSRRNFTNDFKKERNFALVLLILDCIFFLFNVPISCTEQLVAVYENIYELPSSDPTIALIYMLHGFAATTAYVFYTLPFFINLVFNQLFRAEIFRMLKFCRNFQVEHTSNNSRNQIARRFPKITLNSVN